MRKDRAKTERASLDISEARFGSLNLFGSTVEGDVNLNSSTVSETLNMQGGMKIGRLDLRGAKIGGSLLMSDITIERQLAGDFASVGQDFEMSRAHIRDADLSDSEIKGALMCSDAVVKTLVANRVDVKRMGLFGGDKATFSELNLSDSRFGSTVSINFSTIGELVMSRAHIGGDLSLDRTWIKRRLDFEYLSVEGSGYFFNDRIDANGDLIRLRIGGDLSLSGGQLVSIDLTAAQIRGIFFVQSGPVPAENSAKSAPARSDGIDSLSWPGGGSLILQNASAQAFEDRTVDCPQSKKNGRCLDPWPRRVELAGFRYQELGALNLSENMADRSDSYWRNLLGRGHFSTQSYDQLATVLRQDGREELATQMLYDKRDRERETAQGGRKIILWLTGGLIGYGYHPYFAFRWAFLFFLIGIAVLLYSGESKRLSFSLSDAAIFSFDRLIPVITLNKSNDEITLHGNVALYFIFHRIFGFVLASFLVAGITGLTK